MTASIPDFDPCQIQDFARVLPRATVCDLAVSFRANVLALLSALKAAQAPQDAERLRELAHDLKGSSGSFGALRLSALAEHLEHRCDSGAFHDVAPLIAEMGRSATAALAALDSALEDYR